jgi:transcriptional regulator with XRE-family HTH domain
LIVGAGASRFRYVQAFAYVGETLRRLRKELGKTLEELGAEAGLGRGQLSRIENARQEATLSTLAKILISQGVSRREFFRRYDLVEAEAVALSRSKQPATAEVAGSPAHVPELEELAGKLGGWFRSFTAGSPSVARGAVEFGGYVVTFQVVPKMELGAERWSADEDPAASVPPGSKPNEVRGSRRKKAPR